MEKPLYVEKHYTLGPLIVLIATLSIIAFVMMMFALDVKRLLPAGSNWADIWNGMMSAMSYRGPIRTIWAGWANSVLFIGLFSLIFFVFGSWSKITMKVSYFGDKLIVDAHGRRKLIYYKDIKMAWKGFYFLKRYQRTRGRMYVEKFPGGDPETAKERGVINKGFGEFINASQFKNFQLFDEILTWSALRKVYSKRFGTPLFIGRTSYVDLVHVHDEKRVTDILKKYAPSTKLPEYWK